MVFEKWFRVSSYFVKIYSLSNFRITTFCNEITFRSTVPDIFITQRIRESISHRVILKIVTSQNNVSIFRYYF